MSLAEPNWAAGLAAGALPADGLQVALVTPSYPPVIGTTGHDVRALAHALAHLGCEVEVLTEGETSSGPDGPVTVRQFSSAAPSTRYPVTPGLLRHIARHGRRYDVIHIHDMHAPTALAALFAGSEQPVVFSPYLRSGYRRPLSRLRHFGYVPVARTLMRRADRIIAVGQDEAIELSLRFLNVSSRTEVIHHGVSRVGPAKRYDVGPVAMVTGPLVPHRRVDLVIEAMAGLRDLGLVIVGDGPERAALEAQAQRLGLEERTTFVGAVPDHELPRWYATASVLISASEGEPFDLAALEAAVLGCPVLLSDTRAHAEVSRCAPSSIEVVDRAHLAEAITRTAAAGRHRPSPELAAASSWDQAAQRTLGAYGRARDHRLGKTTTPPRAGT